MQKYWKDKWKNIIIWNKTWPRKSKSQSNSRKLSKQRKRKTKEAENGMCSEDYHIPFLISILIY